MPKLLNRSATIPLLNQLCICLIQEKDLSVTGLPRGITHSKLKRFSGVRAKYSDIESFYCRMQSDFHLINLLWKYADRGIT